MSKTDKTIVAFLFYALIVMLTQNLLLLIKPHWGMIYAFMSNDWLHFYSTTDRRFPIIQIYNYGLLACLGYSLYKIHK